MKRKKCLRWQFVRFAPPVYLTCKKTGGGRSTFFPTTTRHKLSSFRKKSETESDSPSPKKATPPAPALTVLLDSFLLASAAPLTLQTDARSENKAAFGCSASESLGSRERAAAGAYEASVPPTGEPTRPSPGFKPCHLKTKTPTHSIAALP